MIHMNDTVWCFMSLSTLLKSYRDDGGMKMKGSVQCRIPPLADLNLGPHDLKSGTLTTQPPGPSFSKLTMLFVTYC